MSGSDGIDSIEDEPYQGLYRGVAQAHILSAEHLPDRFDLADVLKKTRQSKGLTLDEVSETTRVKRAYLEALEQAAYDVLPPRAFAIGYVKAYAKALDLDEETLADMFRRDMAEPQTRLHAPSGASLEDVKPNYRLYISIAGCLVAAIVVWNILQYKPLLLAARNKAGDFASQPWSQGRTLIHDGAMLLTKPAPAPRDQDIPAPYVTPGLEDGFASIAAANTSSAGAPVPVQDVLPSRAFNPQGAVYGAQPQDSQVTIQATKSVSLTLHDAAGSVFFAHQFSPGEAFRLSQLPDQQGQIVDVSDIKGFDVYYNGEFAGPMDTPKMPVGRLNQRAAQMAAALDAKQASQHQVASVFIAAPPPEAPVVVKKSDQPIPYMPSAPKPVEVKPAETKLAAEKPVAEKPGPEKAAPASAAPQ